jgi:putative acyl-CoA dehydrogenase
LQRAWRRIVTPAAKFWICKRALEFTGECMEIWGGNGYVETGPMARFYREAPVNSIWEGSGNVMCLDVLRAIEHEPEGFGLLLEQLSKVAGAHASLGVMCDSLKNALAAPAEQRERMARRLVQKLVLTVQAALMAQHAPQTIAEAFIGSRCEAEGGRVYGTLGSAAGADAQKEILRRILQ